jgi:hypothetical protein
MGYEWEFDLGDGIGDGYTWKFSTSGRPIGPIGRRCHRGPMIPIEVVMSRSFTKMSHMETLRARLLTHVVDTPLVAVQTRETVLRVLNSNLAAMYPAILPIKTSLKVLICEKRNSIPIDQELRPYDSQWKDGIRTFIDYGVIPPHVDLILEGIDSQSPVYRTAARCSAILTAAYIEAVG